MPLRLFQRTCCSLFFVALFAGCNSEVPVHQGSAENLNKIAEAYRAATEKTGKPPQSQADLKPYLPAGADVNKLFTSPNDNEPFVIIWGTDPRTGMDLKPKVVGYEKKGVDGKRFVFTVMGVSMMTDEDFAQANFPPGHKPS